MRTRLYWFTGCIALLLTAVVGSLLFGSSWIPPNQVWQALWTAPTTEAGLAVRTVRVPRTLLAIAAGAAMGAAGALMQGVTRNPLADPGILGVNAGASLLVVIAITQLSITTFAAFLPFALVGALVTSVVVYLLGTRGPAAGSPVTMTLAGAAVTIMALSISSALLLLDSRRLEIFARWSLGSLEGVTLGLVAQAGPLLLVGVALALVSGRLLNALSLGDDVAAGLGQRVGVARGVIVLAVALTCGAATAAVGPVAFVGFAVPHCARRMTGPDYRWIVPFSAVLGAVFLLTADVLGRVVAVPGVVAAGAMTAILGGPVFVMLAQSRTLREL